MTKKHNILLVASECVPFAQTGGLADVAGNLPRALKARGHDVRVVMPRYYAVDRAQYKKIDGALGVPMGVIGTLWGAVYEGTLNGSQVPIYFIDYEQYFGRASIYNDESGNGFLDNDNRFVFLSRAALELTRMIGFRPDVVHVNDWHTAAIPVFLNTVYKDDPVLGKAASLLTIHNMQHQGEFYEGLMDVLGVGWEHFNFLELERYNKVNLLKGGLYHATLINAVSEGYAREIQTPEYGWGLEHVVKERAADLAGIVNGIDYEEWNPATDPLIAANYTAKNLKGKATCKADLQREFGLPVRAEVPVFGMVSRLVEQKGIEMLAEGIDALLDWDLQIVLLGTGEPWAHEFFESVAERRADRFGCKIAFNKALAHKVEAGSDFYLMPSKFEPCGLNQMYSLKYGTIPIVRATGGLDDTVEQYEPETGKGTGFKFQDATTRAFVNTVGWALYTWYNRKDNIKKLIQHAMKQHFSWEDSAKKYEALYDKAVKLRRSK